MGLTPLIGAAVLLIAALLIAQLVRSKTAASLPARQLYRKKAEFLSANELECYDLLRQAVPDMVVAPQVAMGALIEVAPGLTPSERAAAQNKFSRKIVDFVLLAGASLRPVILIELDDASHRPARDAERDAITVQAGYRTVRLRNPRRLTHPEIRQALGLAAPLAPKHATAEGAPA